MRSALTLALLATLATAPPHAQAANKPPQRVQDTAALLPPPCQAIDQSISVVDVFNPAETQGQQLMMLQLYNSGDTCSLNGLPAIDFSAAPASRPGSPLQYRYSRKLAPIVVDEAPTSTTQPANAPVILKHAELAQMRITWSSAAQPHRSCHAVDAIRLALPGDGQATEIVALHTHICDALHISRFTWGWARQSSILRASWAPDASPTDDVIFQSAPGSIYGDHFNGLGISLKTTTGNFPIGADIVLEAHVKNISAPRIPVVGDHPYRWLSMRESNGHTVLYSLGTAPPGEAGQGQPIPRGQGVHLPDLDLRDLGLEPTIIGRVVYALTADFWPARLNADGSVDPDATAYAPTAVVSFRMTLNFVAPY
jgi:hypothetical protein